MDSKSYDRKYKQRGILKTEDTETAGKEVEQLMTEIYLSKTKENSHKHYRHVIVV